MGSHTYIKNMSIFLLINNMCCQNASQIGSTGIDLCFYSEKAIAKGSTSVARKIFF
jgi:hypothetical protein